MKRILFYWVTLILLVAGSCSRIEETTFQDHPSGLVELTVTATMGDQSGTKTVRNPDGSIYWCSGDAINLFYGSVSSGRFTVGTLDPPQPTATFTGQIDVATGSTEIGSGSQLFWGVYPYHPDNTCDGASVTLTFPDCQEGVPGTFANNLNPTVACSTGLDLAFYNVGCWFIFKVAEAGFTTATFTGRNNENVAGTVRVTMDANGKPAYEVIDGVKKITLRPSGGGTFVPGEEYRFCLLPQSFEQGYSLVFEKGADLAIFQDSSQRSFIRSNFIGKNVAATDLMWPVSNSVEMAPGFFWAGRNLGAISETDPGDYYAWGETEPYYSIQHPLTWKEGKTDGYDWGSYRFTEDEGETVSKYGPVDSRTVLEAADDAATQRWGGDWRIPTKKEWDYLLDTNKFTWVWVASAKGYRVYSQVQGCAGNSIFLPAGDLYYATEPVIPGSTGDYWSSSRTERYPSDAYDLYFMTTSYKPTLGTAERIEGHSVRPVYGHIPTPQGQNEGEVGGNWY